MQTSERESGSGTDANVRLQIFGEQGDSGSRKLLRSVTGGDQFESGKVTTVRKRTATKQQN